MFRLFLAALFLSAGLAQAQPAYFRVVGVAHNDTLNVRAGPSASSPDIGDLQPDAVGIEVLDTDPTGTWGRIIWYEGMGWISMRFLAPHPVPVLDGTSVPVGLSCGGTEPFWSIRLSYGSATYSDIIDNTTLGMNLNGARVAAGRPAWPVALAHSSAQGSTLTIITPAQCSDGMSDRDYPYSATVVLRAGSVQRFVEGCCSLPLESGSH